MQSFLQYRRFGKHIERQYERDKSKAEALGNGNSSYTNSGSTTESTTPQISRDVEKLGEHTSGSGNEAIHTTDHATLSTEKSYEPLKSGPSGRTPTNNILDEENPQMSRAATVPTKQSIGTALGTTLTGIAVRDRSTKEGGSGKVFVVGYEGPDDILNPHNWSKWTRFAATVNIAAIGWIVGFASSVDSAALPQASAYFGVSDVTESLATGLFLIGFGTGALLAGPFSETIGRNPVYIVTLSLYMIFVMASALAPNIGAQLAFRFIAGCFAATPLVCAGGSISDLWNPMERVYAFPVFANAAFMGESICHIFHTSVEF